jgi:hypothetical protein
LITVLKQDEEIVFPTFAVISITGPVLGVVVGGNVTTALGGYNSPKSLKLMCLVSFFAIGSSIPVPFLDNFTLVVILVWCLLFAGGFILPTITGIMLNQVEKAFNVVLLIPLRRTRMVSRSSDSGLKPLAVIYADNSVRWGVWLVKSQVEKCKFFDGDKSE